ncbi:SAM-dependent methyltransferase [Flaviaesturariibacter flavus]|uniref:SAM-dependent methyltransferase n=1 Tax=Flaviaesturariibacter flavus TaxID=2502780 RepID=UPI0014043B36|nr:class I SAM-dependent methyltransferase [Flaviaesturariibacter flavus]
MNQLNDQFFAGQYREVWRRTIPAGLTEAECDFILDASGAAPGAPVLDLLCGYGRHALELARRGYPVTAVDNSEPYIDEIRAAAAAEGLPVTAVCAPVQHWAPEGRYAMVICMGNSFAFFDAAGTRVLLQRIAASLEPGGTLIINSWMIAEIALHHFKAREWHELEGYKYLIANEYHLQPARIHSEHTLISAAGGVETIRGVDYIFSLSELESFFGEAGLRLEAIYSTPRKRPFRLGDGRAYLVVRSDK